MSVNLNPPPVPCPPDRRRDMHALIERETIAQGRRYAALYSVAQLRAQATLYRETGTAFLAGINAEWADALETDIRFLGLRDLEAHLSVRGPAGDLSVALVRFYRADLEAFLAAQAAHHQQAAE